MSFIIYKLKNRIWETGNKHIRIYDTSSFEFKNQHQYFNNKSVISSVPVERTGVAMHSNYKILIVIKDEHVILPSG